MTALPDHLRERLAAVSIALSEAAAGYCRVDGVGMYGVPRRVCRAYVWAVHRRADPITACAVAHYGPAPHAEAALRHAAAMAKRLAELGADIPLSVRVAE